MGIVASFMDRRLGAELNEHGVLVWYDPRCAWQPWIESLLGPGPLYDEATTIDVEIGGRPAHLVHCAGSYYELLNACEAVVIGSGTSRLLVYVPGEPYLESLTPLRELECLGGERQPHQWDLTQAARQAFQSAGLSEGKIDELMDREGLDFAYLDSINVGDGGASPLAPIFGSSRETEVIPRFLAEAGCRDEAAAKGLLGEVAKLVDKSLGLPLGSEASPDKIADELARVLLVAEMRSDLQGPEPVAISQIPKPQAEEQVDRVQRICNWLRRDYPDLYESVADKVESDLGLASAELDPLALGKIDTFRFEERRLLQACDGLLAENQPAQALEIVDARSDSFWTSIGRFPERHAAWQACGELARLALTVEEVGRALERPPTSARGWADSYTAREGWHRLDRRFREARYRLSRTQESSTLEQGAEHVFACYDGLVEQIATGFVEALQADRWDVDGLLRQEEVYDRHVARRSEPVAYLLADAMRFEMGAELAELLEAVGATSMRLEPAIACAPTITDVGMVALMPGAERSFSIDEIEKGGVSGVIGGRPLFGSLARMGYAMGQVPSLVEMTMDALLHGLTLKKLAEEVSGAPVVVIRSQEIDGAGENLPNGVAQTVMGTVLEDIRKAALRLADAGISAFVIAADHGHLFGQRRGDDMKIDPPEGGKTVDLHRRCWVGRGGSTPLACVRIPCSELGYSTDLDLMVPRGTGVFKAGGDLAFHHGGLSLQELVIPVLTFDLKGRKAKGKPEADRILLEGAPTQITNRIFSITLRRTDLALEPLRVRLLALDNAGGSTVGQAAFATSGWDAEGWILELKGGDPVSVGIQLDNDEVEELRVVVVEVGTDRTLKDTAPIPVQLLR